MFRYAWGQLSRALATAGTDDDPDTRARAEVRAASWLNALAAMTTGRVHVGSPTPVRDFPAWLTPDILRGGFATGTAAAGGPLAADELAWCQAEGIEPHRARLFAWFLTDAGLIRLGEWLDSGAYRLRLPEHGALLTVAHLLRTGRGAAADELLGILQPWAAQIRFWPYDAAGPAAEGVHVTTIAEVSARLARKQRRPQVEAQREALIVWAPFTDRVVEHWWRTRGEDGEIDAVHPEGWLDGAQAFLDEYDGLAAAHTLTTKHADPKGTLQILLGGLHHRLCEAPESPPNERVGHAIACAVAKRGRPGSPELDGLRTAQERVARQPSHATLAHQVAASLTASGRMEADPDPVALVAELPGTQLGTVRRVLRQATQAPLSVLLDAGIVGSAETLAELAPQLTAETVAARYRDPAAATLAKQLHQAFAQRRSVLLLNHHAQVTIDAIPWFTRLEREVTPQRNADRPEFTLAHAQATDLATLALDHFAGSALPNTLLRELARLYLLAGEEVPLTYELAADIFMGSFSPVFLRAAQQAAGLLDRTLYARYYGIDYPGLEPMAPRPVPTWAGRTRLGVPDFDALVLARAGIVTERWGPAESGRVIEQAQILTTQNLAAVVGAGVLIEPATQARSAWQTTLAHLAKGANGQRLRHRKNAALAWRQTLFYLSLGTPAEVTGFLAEQASLLEGQSTPVATQAQALLTGLAEAARGQAPADGPFLGWVSRDSGS